MVVAAKSPESRPLAAIVWLASYPRSGNTWTRNFLHNLITLVQGGEAATQDINAMGRLTTWEIASHWYEPALGKPPKQATRLEIARVRHAVQAKIAGSVEKLIFVKTHHALVAEQGFPTINMKVTAGAIYIVRNPLDVAVSLQHHFGIELHRAIERLNLVDYTIPPGESSASEVYGSWAQNVESWTAKPHRAIYVMRYEDMLEKPTETFGKLATHLLLEHTPAQLEQAIELSSFDRLKAQEEEKGFRERPKKSEAFFRAGRAEQWREVLSPDQVRIVIRHNRRTMARFGYIPDDYATP